MYFQGAKVRKRNQKDKLNFCNMKKNVYQIRKAAARGEAIDFQNDFNELVLSWYDLASYQAYFETLGRRYGLLREFRENGII